MSSSRVKRTVAHSQTLTLLPCFSEVQGSNFWIASHIHQLRESTPLQLPPVLPAMTSSMRMPNQLKGQHVYRMIGCAKYVSPAHSHITDAYHRCKSQIHTFRNDSHPPTSQTSPTSPPLPSLPHASTWRAEDDDEELSYGTERGIASKQEN